MIIYSIPSVLFFLFCVAFLQGFCSASTVSLPESLLFVSTLDGNLHAVSKKSGSIKWTLKEGKRRGLDLKVTFIKAQHLVQVTFAKTKFFCSLSQGKHCDPTTDFNHK